MAKMGLGRKVLIICLCITTLGLIAGGVSVYLAARNIKTSYEEVQAAFRSENQRILPLYLADQQALKQHSFFLPSAGQSDAQGYLVQVEQNKQLELPEHLSSKPEIYKEALELQWDDVNTEWMQKLQDYDHLLITQRPKNREQLSQNPYTLPLNLDVGPLSRYSDWFRLRILKGLSDNDMDSAVTEARQLAYLLLNSESLLHSLVGIAMLNWENEAHAYWQSKNKVPENWQPMDPEHVAQAKRVYTASGSFALLGITPPETMEQVFGNPDVKIGMCQGLMEGATTLMSYNFFPERQEQAERMSQWAQERNCKHDYITRLWSAPKKASENMFSQNDELYPLRYLKWVPGLNRAIGYTLESIAIPNYSAAYPQEAHADATPKTQAETQTDTEVPAD